MNHQVQTAHKKDYKATRDDFEKVIYYDDNLDSDEGAEVADIDLAFDPPASELVYYDFLVV